MIDTVVLLLDKSMFTITDPDKFKPSAAWALATHIKDAESIQSKQSHSKKDLLNGIYKPRLLLAHRINHAGGRTIVLRIEVSLPKLLHGNSFVELQYNDFQTLVTKLVASLQTMGVAVTADIIANAPVSAIHYAKNIRLTDGSTPYIYINKIKQSNVKLSLDVNQTDYRNDGHSYKWHCNSYEVVFYDKIKELEKAKNSSKRAIEKDNELQLHLFDRLKKRKMFELLRMEVRLNRRQKIKQLLSKLGIAGRLTFKKLFKPAISKKVLLHYLDELESKRPPLLDYKASNAKALLVDLVFSNPMLGPKQILQIYGLKLALDTMDPRELRLLFAKYSARSWYRLMADANTVALPHMRYPFAPIREQLSKFRAFRMRDIERIKVRKNFT